jgi:hypothetical protein
MRGEEMKYWRLTISLLIFIFLIFMVTGFKFTALSAAKSNPNITKDFELVEKYDAGTTVIYLFKSNEKKLYRTVLSEKSGLLFRSSSSTYIPYSKDSLQTVGGISYRTDKDAFTLLSVISFDDDVAYIEAGADQDLQRKEIKKRERISFLFPFSKQIDLLNAAAFNKNGKKLYYYGYPNGANSINSKDLKWHKINE